ncbi:MAG: peptide ABC transporter substrate-binding protein [Coriobacteriia bacterium]|nr:peptide ABC transporter substrate-binding protein [Coriobacteriia bacterium]
MSDRFRKLLVLTLALVLGLSLVTGCGRAAEGERGGDERAVEPKVGGTLVIGYEQEPEILNPFIEGGDMMATKDVVANVLWGLVRVRPDFTYEPLLVEEVPTLENGLVTEDPFTVTYKIREEAVWSDGTPVTGEDVEFTWQTTMDEKNKILSRTGYEDIERIDADGKTAKLTFKKPYAAYKDLFAVSQTLLPKHALEGKDFNEVINAEIPVASGPFVFKEWAKGDSITLERNEAFWSEHTSYLDAVTFKFIPDTNTEVAQFKTGEVDAINPAPDVSLIEQLEAVEGADVQADPGTIWEHLGFNLEKVSDARVRQAVAYAVDRDAISNQVMKGQVSPLQSIFVPEQASVYVSAWEKYAFDTTKAEQLLGEAGYAKGADGYYAKGGNRLTIEIKSTAGNAGREKVQQIMQSQLKDVGIELRIDNEEPSTFLGSTVVDGTYELGLWAWLASPDPGSTFLYASDAVPPGGQNYYRYRNDQVTEWLKASDAEVDEAARAELLKKVQTQIAEDVPLIPLYQRLSIVAARGGIHNVENNATLEGVFWNLGEWWKE